MLFHRNHVERRKQLIYHSTVALNVLGFAMTISCVQMTELGASQENTAMKGTGAGVDVLAISVVCKPF